MAWRFGGSMFRSACKPHLCLLYRYALRKSGSCGYGHQYSHARHCDVSYKIIFGDSSGLVQGASMPIIAIPFLDDIPFIGKIFFRQSLLAYLAYLAIPLSIIFFTKFRSGLSYRSVGENPQAAETLGVNVIRTKYLCIVCGALAGSGGSFFDAGVYLYLC